MASTWVHHLDLTPAAGMNNLHPHTCNEEEYVDDKNVEFHQDYSDFKDDHDLPWIIPQIIFMMDSLNMHSRRKIAEWLK